MSGQLLDYFKMRRRLKEMERAENARREARAARMQAMQDVRRGIREAYELAQEKGLDWKLLLNPEIEKIIAELDAIRREKHKQPAPAPAAPKPAPAAPAAPEPAPAAPKPAPAAPAPAPAAPKPAPAAPKPAPAAPKPAPAKPAPVTGHSPVARLRNTVIAEMKRTNDFIVRFGTILWGEANSCFPGGPNVGWDSATLCLNVQERKLYAEVGTYPNAYGASYEDKIPLTPEEFHKKAISCFKRGDLFEEMKTQSDWDRVFNAEVEATVAAVKKAQEEKQRKLDEENRLRHAVVIANRFNDCAPRMLYTEVCMKHRRPYGEEVTTVCQEGGRYRMNRTVGTHLRRDTLTKERALTAREAAWFEAALEKAMKSEEASTFQSLPGGDRMDVVIRQGEQVCFERTGEMPLQRFVDLHSLLTNLIFYGSLAESETDRKPD